MQIKEIQAKSIITPSKLPGCDFVINPYTGCSHACVYCYACFMQRFTEHQEAWGEFVDVKVNAVDLVAQGIKKLSKNAKTTLIMGSVTDPYQAVETKYQLTRKILEKLIPLDNPISITTKSSLITRDIDLLKQQKNCTVAISLSTLDDRINKLLEPRASSVQSRIDTLKALHDANIRTVLFVSPILPKLTPLIGLITATTPFVDEYWFENLNLYPTIQQKLKAVLDQVDKQLWQDTYVKKYYSKEGPHFWHKIKTKIVQYCTAKNIAHQIFFHH